MTREVGVYALISEGASLFLLVMLEVLLKEVNGRHRKQRRSGGRTELMKQRLS